MMFDWLWKGVAGAAGLAALWFGIRADRAKKRAERDEAERKAAMDRMVEQAYRSIEETRKKHAGQSPINPGKRTDFEDGH